MAYLEPLFTGDVNDLQTGGGKQVIIAPGNYKACIVTEEVKDNKNKNGKLLVLNVEIIEGEYKGISFTDFINITNPNAIAQRLGQERKARIGAVLFNNPNFPDSAALKNKIITIEVTTEPNEYTNKEGVEVKGVKNIIKWYHPAGAPTAAKAPPVAHSTHVNGAGGVTTNADYSESDIPF